MLTGRIRSTSEPPPSTTGRTSIEAKKTASVPDLHGKLTTSAGITSLRLTEPLKLSRPASGIISVRDRNQQISDHHAELVPALDLGQGVQGNISELGPGATGPEPIMLLESSRLSPGPRMESYPAGEPGKKPFRISITDTLKPTTVEVPKKTAEQKPAGHPDFVPDSVEARPQQTKKKGQPTHSASVQQVSAGTAGKGNAAQDRSKLIAEVRRLIAGATPEQLKASSGDLKKLAGIDKSLYTAALASDKELIKIFKTDYNRSTRGGSDFQPDFIENLIKNFETSVEKLQKTKSSQSTGGVKKAGKIMIDQMPGLQDVFLARAVNHLITGELHKLDPIIGDEGCQIRTPFVLDMHRLVQEKMPKNAVELVRDYREKTEGEQNRVLEQLKDLEAKRKNQDKKYESDVSEFVGASPLKESMKAKSGEYKAMFSDLIDAIKEKHPGAVEYLKHVCSEGAIYWDSVLDPFGLSIIPDQNPIFPNNMLARRKMAQSKLSKDYLVKSAANLVRKDGGEISEEERDVGFDKKGKAQKLPSFLTVQSKKNTMPAMLLHALQMNSAAAVTRGERLELGCYWETTRLALTHALKNGYPLIVNIRRLTVSGEGDDRQYSSNVCKTLFYEPTDKGYQYQPHPSAEQQSQGALLFQGYSMLKEGDTGIPGATVPIAPWVVRADPEEFLDGFTKCDVVNLMLLGDVGTHHPLNTGGSGSGAYAYGLPGRSQNEYSFDHDPGGWKYVDAVHNQTLSDLKQPLMTQQGQEYLTPDFQLTKKSKGLLFPDQCPVDIAGTGTEFNIQEEYQLMKSLCQAAGMKDTMYARHNRQTSTAERVAQSTMPFVSTHILASTFSHENKVSSRFSSPKTRGVSEKLDELRKK